MKMAAKFCVLMVLLIWSECAHKAGVKGDDTPTFFSSAGGQVTLPCTNALFKNCSSTTWIYNGGNGRTTELVGHGLVKQDSQTNLSQRLTVASNCSLNIDNVTAEDVGVYTCQQYPIEGGPQKGVNAPVNLAVLQILNSSSVSASSEVKEIEPGSEVTLQCLLLTHDTCGRTVENKGVNVSWVDKENKELRKTSNRHIKTLSVCNITIAEKLVDLKPSEKQRSWTCQLTADGQIKASTTYSIRVKASKPTSVTTPSPTSAFSTISASASSTKILEDHTVFMIVGVLVASLLSAIILIVVICKKRANSGWRTQNNVDENRLYDMISESYQPLAHEQSTEDLHYVSVDHLNQEQSTKHARNSPVDTMIQLMPPPSDETENKGSVDHACLYAAVQHTV